MTSQPSLARHIAPRIDEARLTRQLSSVRARLGAPRYARARLLGYAVAVVGVVAIAMLVQRGRSVVDAPEASALATFETSKAGERLTIAERAELVLDAQTRVKLGSISSERVRLELERGGVELDVLPRAGQSFEIGAAGYLVRVVGTRFDVRFVAPGRLSVGVAHGRVEVRNQGDGGLVRTLGAGESWSTALPPEVARKAVAEHSDVSRNTAPDAVGAAPEPPATAPAELEPAAEAKPAESNPVRAARSESAREIFERAQRARANGRTAESAAAFRELRARYPNDPRAALAAFELGRLELEASGDAKRASKTLEEAARAAPEGSALREDAEARRIDALDAAGERDACLAAQRAYLARYPNSVHRARVLARCRKP